MIATFLAQYAAGCFLAVSVSSIRQSSWRYLRLMAIVSTAIAILAGVFLFREAGGAISEIPPSILISLACGVLLGFVWLFVNAAQSEQVRATQRIWPAGAGLVCLVAAAQLALRSGTATISSDVSTGAIQGIAVVISTILGAGLLGSATAAMLLGHRYLTDTNMPIGPLRRLTRIYLGVIALRIVWVTAASLPIWSAGFRPADSPMYFWMALSVRIGAGLVVAGVFAWMVWDCVKRRATQSATALFYLSMLLIFIGELSGQYLMRTEQLAL
ncbi:MAG: hypothetical protein ACE5EQ_04065 [Phycisphaerae bacterium]